MKTIHEIKAEFGERSAGIANRYREELDAITAASSPEDGRYLDLLSAEERMRLLREQKAQRANEARSEALEGYRDELERYRLELNKRSSHLKARLFGVGDATALSAPVGKSEEQLREMLEVASHAGNADLARAVFVAADKRNLGDLMAEYFDKVDPEARDLYEEWRAIPPAEVLERQQESAELIIPNADPASLMPPARAAS